MPSCALFDRLFPRGFAGPDVLDEITPDGWERSSLLACFHRSIERLLEERLSMHRHLVELRRMRPVRGGATSDASQPEPSLEDVRREYEPRPVQRDEEVTELVGIVSLIFSGNHEVITADGRLADLGSFGGSSAFLDEYLNPDGGWWREGDDMRFYMGTIFLRNRAELAPVYSMIFRRLDAVGADWIYHFPEHCGALATGQRSGNVTPLLSGKGCCRHAQSATGSGVPRSTARGARRDTRVGARRSDGSVTARDCPRVPRGVRAGPSRRPRA